MWKQVCIVLTIGLIGLIYGATEIFHSKEMLESSLIISSLCIPFLISQIILENKKNPQN